MNCDHTQAWRDRPKEMETNDFLALLCFLLWHEQAVAVGAAVQGHILAMGDARTGGADLAGTTDLLLLDVTPLSLGIELEGREMSVLIKRNTTIPCRKSRSYTTVEDWQTSIDVVVYEVGEREEAVLWWDEGGGCYVLFEITFSVGKEARCRWGQGGGLFIHTRRYCSESSNCV